MLAKLNRQNRDRIRNDTHYSEFRLKHGSINLFVWPLLLIVSVVVLFGSFGMSSSSSWIIDERGSNSPFGRALAGVGGASVEMDFSSSASTETGFTKIIFPSNDVQLPCPAVDVTHSASGLMLTIKDSPLGQGFDTESFAFSIGSERLVVPSSGDRAVILDGENQIKNTLLFPNKICINVASASFSSEPGISSLELTYSRDASGVIRIATIGVFVFFLVTAISVSVYSNEVRRRWRVKRDRFST